MRGTDVRVFLNELDISGDTAEVTLDTTVEEYEAATLTSFIADYSPGINSGEIGINGYLNGVEDGFEDKLRGALATSGQVVAMLLDYTSLPAPAYVCENSHENNLTWASPVDGLITMEGTFKAKRGVKRGKLLEFKSVRSATGIGSAVQLPGALVGMSGKAFVFLHAVGGTQTTPVTLKVQSSANGTTGWADEASFSFADLGAQAIAISSPAGAYFAVDVTSLGGATSVTISWIISLDGLT
jgi:hypothetical protein